MMGLSGKNHIKYLLYVIGISLCIEVGCTSSNQVSETPQEQNDTANIDDGLNQQIVNENNKRSDEAIRDSLNAVLKDEIHAQYQSQANRLTTFYILAQQRFYSGDYQQALFLINRAANIKESADVLALRGSIYFGLGSIENFVSNWREALEKDRNVPIPPSPPIIEELKNQGLINENLERNF